MSFSPPEYADSDLVGMDFSWLAVDRDGHVAWLVTFGSAVVPSWVDADPYAFEDVEDMLAALPERCGVSPSHEDSTVEEWRAAAQRGVFAFDWVVYEGPYMAIAKPEAPIQVDELPEEMTVLAKRTQFKHLCFAERDSLHVVDVQSCLQGVATISRSRCPPRT